MQHHEESPFHAVGFALMAYVEAMLGFETDKIQTALERIAAAEILARQFAKKARRKSWHNRSTPSSSTTTKPQNTTTAVEDEYASLDSISFFNRDTISLNEKISYQPQVPPATNSKKYKSPEIQYELLATNCMLMSSTIQFLRNSWLEYMKAAYKLRKAYKLYEQMFESLTGQKASEYASLLKSSSRQQQQQPQTATNSRRRTSLSTPLDSTPTTPFEQQQQQQTISLSAMLANSPHVKASWNERRISLFHIPQTSSTADLSTTNHRMDDITTKVKRRPMSTLDLSLSSIENMPASCDSFIAIDNAIESGIFFGIGLFSLIFSLLPPRGKAELYYKVWEDCKELIEFSDSEQNIKYTWISFISTLCPSLITKILQKPRSLQLTFSTVTFGILYQFIFIYSSPTITQLTQS